MNQTETVHIHTQREKKNQNGIKMKNIFSNTANIFSMQLNSREGQKLGPKTIFP